MVESTFDISHFQGLNFKYGLEPVSSHTQQFECLVNLDGLPFHYTKLTDNQVLLISISTSGVDKVNLNID